MGLVEIAVQGDADASRWRARLGRWRAFGLGLSSSCIWASSFVLIKMGLRDTGPLTLGGLRYAVAFLLLLPLLPVQPADRRLPRRLGVWLALAAAGLLAYPIANGLLFSALGHLDATSASFVFNQSPVCVVLIGIVALKEWPTRLQVLGFVVIGVGMWMFFGVPSPGRDPLWLLAALGAAAAFSAFSVWVRHLTTTTRLGTVALTTWPLAVGGTAMLLIGVLAEGPPRPSWDLTWVVGWLAALNTSLAYLCWNLALRDLRAYEVNVFLAMSPMATALLAWPLLGEHPSLLQFPAMAVAMAGIVLVSVGRRAWQRPASPPALPGEGGGAGGSVP
jgi:drug/metabolite transporter (DMT)-like permease